MWQVLFATAIAGFGLAGNALAVQPAPPETIPATAAAPIDATGPATPAQHDDPNGGRIERALLTGIQKHMGATTATAELDASATTDETQTSLGALLRSILTSLALVLALIVVVAFVLRAARRYTPATGNATASVLLRLPLSPKSSLVLVELLDRVLVIGDGEGGPRLLTSIDNPEEVARLRGDALAAPGNRNFGDQFRRMAGLAQRQADQGSEVYEAVARSMRQSGTRPPGPSGQAP